MGLRDRAQEIRKRAQRKRRWRVRRERQVQRIQRRLRRARQLLREQRESRPRSQDGKERKADRIEALEARIELLDEKLAEARSRYRRLTNWFRRARRRLTHIRNRIRRRRDYASVHFRYAEFDCREGDPVPEYMYPHLRHLCRTFLERMRAEFGPAHSTSGHRWEWYNRKIGGATKSHHVYENRREEPADDLTFEKGTPAQWAAYARKLADELGVGGVGQYRTFVHVDTGPRRDWSG